MKRFDVTTTFHHGTMEESPVGDYVLHAEACPQWTRELPTKPGAYWLRTGTKDQRTERLIEVCEYVDFSPKPSKDEGRLFVRYVGTDCEDWINKLTRYEHDPEWCGPLYNPDAS